MPSERVQRAQVLVVEDCPNAGLTVERLRQVLDETGAAEINVEVRVLVPGERPPEGFAGSPTVLLDDVDPFASDSSGSSGVACRIYPADMREQGALSLYALRSAVKRRSRLLLQCGDARPGDEF